MLINETTSKRNESEPTSKTIPADCLGHEGRTLIEAGKCLVSHVETMAQQPYQMSAAALQLLLDSMKKHLRLMESVAEFKLLPKHHLWVHLVARAHTMGNPARYNNFFNEALNKVLKLSCRNASQITFEETVLAKTRRSVKSACGKRARPDPC